MVGVVESPESLWVDFDSRRGIFKTTKNTSKHGALSGLHGRNIYLLTGFSLNLTRPPHRSSASERRFLQPRNASASFTAPDSEHDVDGFPLPSGASELAASGTDVRLQGTVEDQGKDIDDQTFDPIRSEPNRSASPFGLLWRKPTEPTTNQLRSQPILRTIPSRPTHKQPDRSGAPSLPSHLQGSRLMSNQAQTTVLAPSRGLGRRPRREGGEGRWRGRSQWFQPKEKTYT